MQSTESVPCPFCGQTSDLIVETTIDAQRFTIDCEVCCRPFEVIVECEDGNVIRIEVPV